MPTREAGHCRAWRSDVESHQLAADDRGEEGRTAEGCRVLARPWGSAEPGTDLDSTPQGLLHRSNSFDFGHHSGDGIRPPTEPTNFPGSGGLAAPSLQAHLNDGHSPLIGAEEMPPPRKGIAAVLGEMPAEAERAGLGSVLWWYLSGVTHSASYGLMQAIEAQETKDALGTQMGAIFTDARSVILMAWAAATAFTTMTETRR